MYNKINSRLIQGITCINSRTLSFKKTNEIILTYESGIIINVKSDSFYFDLYDYISMSFKDDDNQSFNSNFQCCRIELSNGYVYIYNNSLNMSYTYILPMFINNISDLFLNMYITNTYIKKGLTKFVIECRFFNTDNYINIDKYLSSNNLYSHSVNIHKTYKQYFFDINNKENLDDIKLFMDGKYSKLSQKLKYKIVKCHKNNGNIETITNILNYSTVLKDKIEKLFEVEVTELSSKPICKQEIYEYTQMHLM